MASAPGSADPAPAWDDRRATAEGNAELIASLSEAVAEAPQQDTMVLLSRALLLQALVHADTAEARSEALADSLTWAERSLMFDDRFRAAIEQGRKQYEALDTLQRDDQAGACLAGEALLWWSRDQGFTVMLQHKRYLRALLLRCEQLDETAGHGTAARLWGIYHASMPALGGGRLDESAEHFARAIELAPTVAQNRYDEALTYATRIQDRELFRSLLQQVAGIDPASPADVAVEQALYQREAADLLAAEDSWFSPRR